MRALGAVAGVLLTACGASGGAAGTDAATSSASGGSGDGSGSEGGAAPSPSSCMGGGTGMTDCGARSESCCTSLAVAGGAYSRTYANAGSGATGEASPATVTGFRLDEYLVTVGRFRQFVKAVLPADGGAPWLPPPGSGKHTHLNDGNGLNGTGGGYEPGWVASDDGNVVPTDTNLGCQTGYSTWTASAGSQENLPINCVNWYEAYAFCIWDGGFLPSEAEWEYAAAGGSQQREYPWGSIDPGTSNQYAIYGCNYPSGSGSCAGVTNIAPVGTATLGAGLWGQLDLAGEIFEWNLDEDASYVDPCVDCANFTAASSRVIRGGDFAHPRSYTVATYRFGVPSTLRQPYDGFRCARTP